MTFSLCINHTPWKPERATALNEMLRALDHRSFELPFFLNDKDYRGQDWQVAKVDWAMRQWQWAAKTPVTHHLFMTDDLHIAPNFWDILTAMTAHSGESPIGLLSNHPCAREAAITYSWYRTNSWLVGPAYVLSHGFLLRFLAWFSAKPDGNAPGAKGYANDDSSINEFVSHVGACTLHPLPTIIEHRQDIGSTVGHGDRFSCERLSWRALRWTEDVGPNTFEWREKSVTYDMAKLCKSSYWAGAEDSPLLKVGG